MSPLRHLGTLWAVLCAVLVSACATVGVSTFVARGADFTRYHTYSWAAGEQQETGDPRLDNNPFFHARVLADVDEQLSRRGFEKITSGTPDFVVHYYASVAQRLDLNGTGQKYGSCRDCTPYVFDAGTLLIDVVDARTNLLVWRGWAEDSVDGLINDQPRFEQRVDAAVTRILERLPRRL